MSLFSMNDKGDGNKYAVIPDVKGLEDGQKQLKDSQKQLENKHDGDVQAMQELLEEMSAFAVGDIKWSSADLTQAGFLVANGAEVGRATYPDLCAVYEAMGFPWGAGDGSTTFNLPNLIGRFAEGADSAGGYHEAGLPNIKGNFLAFNGADGAFNTLSDSRFSQVAGSGHGLATIQFNSRKSSTIYGNSTTVQPPSALLIPYVKAFNGASSSSTDLEITQVANEVAEKANMDLSNLSEKGRKAFFPSDTWIDITNSLTWTPSSSGVVATYVAPANGFVFAEGLTNDAGTNETSIWSTSGVGMTDACNASGVLMKVMTITRKADKVSIFFTNNMTRNLIRFIYAEGEV